MTKDNDANPVGNTASGGSGGPTVMLQQQPQQVSFNFEAFDKSKTTWARWVQRFELALEIFNCDTGKKKKYLLHFMGAETYDLLSDRIYPKTVSQLIYDEISRELASYFDPEPNEILENYRFHVYKQKEEQSCDDFLKELRRLSAHCNFGNYLDTAIRNQFVFGLKSQALRSRLLEKKDLTLEKAIEVAKAMEVSSRGCAEIQEKATVNAIQAHGQSKKKKQGYVNTAKTHTTSNSANNTNTHKTSSDKSKACYRCGSSQHLANSCSHSRSICRFCSKQGHLQSVCFKKKKEAANFVEERAETLTVEDLCPIYEQRDKLQEIHDLLSISNAMLRSKLIYDFTVNDISIAFEIDTGAPVSLISAADAKRWFGKLSLNENDTGLQSYCYTPLDILGFIYVRVKTPIPSPVVKLYIVRSDRKPLLGREWLRQLEVDWLSILAKLLGLPEPIRSTHTVKQLHITSTFDLQSKLKELVQRYARVFDTASAGKIVGTQARLHMKADATPKFYKARRVPFPLLQPVERELDRMVTDGILLKVDTSDWATPIVPVPKSQGEVRICGDYKITVNMGLLIDEYPLPTVNELFSTMAGGQKFSKIDLSKAYLQMEVHPDDRCLLTLNTHKGLFQPTRLMFGVANAPAKFQKFMEGVLRDIPGVSVFIDDIRVTAASDDEHWNRLTEVLKRLNELNMRVNLQKSEFMKDHIVYCGHIIDRNGIRQVPKKAEAIMNMKIPTSREEVRAFLGLINYYGRFLSNLSTVLYPVNQLLKDNVKFHWSSDCDKAYDTIKRMIASDLVLAHYNPKETLVLATDASPVGVGAVLSHIYKDGSERPIHFASQTLSPTQQRYSQIDREAYAIIFGVRKFYQYVYGRKFILVTDNKPLAQIFAPNKGLPLMSATRMQHYAIFLSSFDYELRVKKSKENSNADAMSRLPNADEVCQFIEEIDMIEVNMIENIPLTVPELSEATSNDESIRTLIQALKCGRICNTKDRFDVNQVEFSMQQGCLMRGIRVYIPSILRERVLNELHSAHFGMTKMKSLARGYCWWPKMDMEIETMVSNCKLCQSVRPEEKKVFTHHWVTPNGPFERVHADFAGPIHGLYLFILVDAYTKWPEVHVISNITAETTITKCREIFATFGIPNCFVSDWGTQFTSNEFHKFLKSNGIQHKKGAPYHPATNGQAERYVQTVKDKLKTISCQKNELRKQIAQILFAYRRAIHSSTGKSPAMMMFGRQIRNRLDLMIPNQDTKADQKQPEVNKQFMSNDRVAVRDYLSNEKWQFGIVDKRMGKLHYDVKLDDGRQWKRHVDQMRKVGENVQSNSNDQHVPINSKPAPISNEAIVDKSTTEQISTDKQSVTESIPSSSNDTLPSTNLEIPIVEQGVRRSTRVSKPPNRLQYH